MIATTLVITATNYSFIREKLEIQFFLCRKHAVAREQSQGHHDQFMKCTNNKLISLQYTLNT